MSFAGDRCLSIFGTVYAAGALVFPPHAKVLEIGCAEADWMTPMLALRPDLQITGIDWRACERPGTVIQGDVLTQDFPPNSFDAVVGISSVEHVGLGHYDADPIDADGDVRCLAKVREWLKPGGWVYADVPYGTSYRVIGTEYRAYDEAAVQTRLIQGLRPLGQWFFTWQGLLTDRPDTSDPHLLSYVAVAATKEGAW